MCSQLTRIRTKLIAQTVMMIVTAAVVFAGASAHDFGGETGAGAADNAGSAAGGGANAPGGGGGAEGPDAGDDAEGDGEGDGEGAPPDSPGNPNNDGSGDREGCPVVFFSGAETVSSVDVVVNGAFPIVVQRRYDSQTDYDSPLGHGWAFEFDRRLYEYPDNSVVVRYSCGLKDKYILSGGSYVTPAGVGRLGALLERPDGTFELTYLNGMRDYFDGQGRLIAVREPQGNRHELTYDSRGKLPLMGSSKQAIDPSSPMTVALNYRVTRIDERAADGTLTGHYLVLSYDEGTGRLTGVTTHDGRSITYEHDQHMGGTRGNLIRVNGLAGIASEYQYNDARDPHNLTHHTPVSGKATVVNTYDDQDRVIRQEFGSRQLDFEYLVPLTHTRLTRTVRDANGLNPYAEVETFEFDPSGKITRRTDPLGNEFRYILNSAKLIARKEVWQKNLTALSLLQAVDWTYDGMGNKLTESVTLDTGEIVNRTWTYEDNWIASEQVVSSAAPLKIFRTEYTFFDGPDGVPVNVHEMKRRLDNGSFQTVTYAYDARNRRVSTTFPDGVQHASEYTGEWVTRTFYRVSGLELPQMLRRFDYDTRGFLTKEWDARNNLTQYGRDALGRITSITNALNEETLIAYTDRVLTLVERGRTAADGEGRITRLLYDDRNRLNSVERKNDAGSFSPYVTYQLDSEGRKLAVTDAVNRTVTMAYDLAGRMSRVTDAAGNQTQFTYDAAGNRTAKIDALNREMRFEYDDLNRRTAVVELGVTPNPRTQYQYDAAHNVIAVTDAENHTTSYSFDALSRTVAVTLPLGQSTQYEYDGRDRITSIVTARGHRVDHAYEPWGPLKEMKHYASTSATSPMRTIGYGRDSDGNVISESDDSMQAGPIYTKSFDVLGRPYDETVKYIPGGDRILRHRYDRFGNRGQLILEDGTTTTSTFSYNKLNQLITANLAGAGVTASYFQNDELQSLAFPNGVNQQYTYKPNGLVDAILVNGPGGPLSQHVYSYDDALNVTAITDAEGTSTFGYDGLDRLTQTTRPASSALPNESYVYDRVGNRKDAGNPSQWTYDDNNRVMQAGALSYGFDGGGNVATISNGATFTHDAENRLVAHSKNSVVATYLYEPGGRRTRKTVAGVSTWFLWDGDRLLAEYDGSGIRVQRYGYLPGQHVALQTQALNATYYVHADRLQAPHLLTNGAGAVVWRAKYAAYGQSVVDPDVDGNGIAVEYRQRFPGQYADAENGLLYNYFRNYDPTTGRYVQSDPIGLRGGVNMYLYVRANPLRAIDPFGLDAACTPDAKAAEEAAKFWEQGGDDINNSHVSDDPTFQSRARDFRDWWADQYYYCLCYGPKPPGRAPPRAVPNTPRP